MSVVVYLCVCPYVCKSMERKLNLYETLIYFRYFDYFLNILLFYVYWGKLWQSFDFVKDILISYQNSPKSVIYLF